MIYSKRLTVFQSFPSGGTIREAMISNLESKNESTI